MTEINNFGASPDEWGRLLNSTIRQWALPVVTNPGVPIAPHSTIKFPGKLPSIKNKLGEVVGIAKWTTQEPASSRTINKWSKDPDLGFCIRTGHDGIIAIDCDCDDAQISAVIKTTLAECLNIDLNTAPIRCRGNSPRWACLVQTTKEAIELKNKRIIYLSTPTNNAVEILAEGQQLICCGCHPSGARYRWTGDGFGVIQADPLNVIKFINTVSSLYGIEEVQSQNKTRTKEDTFTAHDKLAVWLNDHHMVKEVGDNGEVYISCPWEAQHSSKSGDRECCYFPIGSNGYTQGGFKCLHAHCANRTITDLTAWARSQGFSETSDSDFPIEQVEIPAIEETATTSTPGTVPEPSTVSKLLKWTNEKTGLIKGCITAVLLALKDPDYCGFYIAWDTFYSRPVYRPKGTNEWIAYSDTINTRIRCALELRGFAPGSVNKDLINDAVMALAEKNQIDTMAIFLAETLPQWDGVERCAQFLNRYCGAEDSEYTRAVGRYFWGMLYRRASSPDPVKADISLVLIGQQGANKTQFIQRLAISPEYYTDLSFSESNKELAMRMIGRTICEYPEMRGFGEKRRNDIKAFLTIDRDMYRPLYSNEIRTVTRRCVFVMTINQHAFLSDATGNRRYAPVEVAKFDAASVEPDLLQLWAEGAEIFKRYGGKKLHEDVEQFTLDINEKYTLTDVWEDVIAEWLAEQEDASPEERIQCTTRAVMQYALKMDTAHAKHDDLRRVADVLQGMGYEYRSRRGANGRVFKEWVRKKD